MKTRTIFMLIYILMIYVCYATDVITGTDTNIPGPGPGPKPPLREKPEAHHLIDDRFRNTIAVDPEDPGTYGIRFYATSFGLDDFDGTNNSQIYAPVPKKGSLVRFGIVNSNAFPWSFSQIHINQMDEAVFENPNGYNEQEQSLLRNYYSTVVQYSPVLSGTEGDMRYDSGTGCWASPVLYKGTDNQKHLIILNKSGYLMSLNVENEDLRLDWKLNLRVEERRTGSNSFKYEFMATPFLHDNKLYIPGIRLFHVVDISSANPTDYTYSLNVGANDYFDKPVVYEKLSETNNRMLIVSYYGEVFNFESNVLSKLTTNPLGKTLTQPVIDSDGHFYFVSRNSSNNQVLHMINLKNRYDNAITHIASKVVPPEANLNDICSALLTDFTQNKYLFSNNNFVRLDQGYNFQSLTGDLDPISSPSAISIYNPVYIDPLGSNTISWLKFPWNHSVSFYNKNLQTCLFSITNQVSPGYMYHNGQDVFHVSNYYPTTQAQYNLSTFKTTFLLASFGYKSESFVQTTIPQDDNIFIIEDHVSWGGVAPYVSSANACYNAIFGDENGCVVTYNAAMNTRSVNFNETIDDLSKIIPDLGCSKFMKNQDNILANNEVTNTKVYIYDLNGSPQEQTRIFIDANSAMTVTDDLPGTDYQLQRAIFDYLIPNDRFLITWDISNELSMKQCKQVSIKKDNEVIVLNSTPDLIVNNTNPNQNIPDLTITFPSLHTLSFNSITVENGAYLKIADNSHIKVNKLILKANTKLVIGHNAVLTADVIESISPSPDFALIDFSGDTNLLKNGKLIVNLNIENKSSTTNIGNNLILKGYNVSSVNYQINRLINKPNCDLTFESGSTTLSPLTSNNSFKINSIKNEGDLYCNDIVEVAEYENMGGVNSSLKIAVSSGKKGHLKIKNLPGTSVTQMRPFTIGYNSPVSAENAILSIISTPFEINSYTGSIYGTLKLLDGSICKILNHGTMEFFQNSKLELKGSDNPQQNGSSLEILGTSVNDRGELILNKNVTICGYKPKPTNSSLNYDYGDRIITNDFGRIIGEDPENHRLLDQLSISSSRSDRLKWEGLSINTVYPETSDLFFMLANSSITGIDKIFVKYPIIATYLNNTYENCEYGVFDQTSVTLPSVKKSEITNCSFKGNTYGIYIEDLTQPANQNDEPTNLQTTITNCKFGIVEEEDPDIDPSNTWAISLHRCAYAEISGSSFGRNVFGILNTGSIMHVGGSYVDGTPVAPQNETSRNKFYQNTKYAIYADHLPNIPPDPTDLSGLKKNLICGNNFSGTGTAEDSGIGLLTNFAAIDVVGNSFVNLGGHGALLNGYSWYTNLRYHGFAGNGFNNNLGCELIGNDYSLSFIKNGRNVFNDIEFSETNIIPEDPLHNYNQWDKYIIAGLGGLTNFAITDISGNTFPQIDPVIPNRFYPSIDDFIIVNPNPSSPLSQLLDLGITQFYQGQFSESIGSMKQVVETYPDSLLTKFAINFLYLATNATDKDFVSLRNYLDLKIDSIDLKTYLSKEEVKTKCYVSEKDFPTAIERLQLIINNADNRADSLFALINQAYCYMNLALSGSKSLPHIQVDTRDFKSYSQFLADLDVMGATDLNQNNIQKVLTLDTNYPNPFNPSTTIRFSIPQDGNVKVAIYNIKGQRVKELINEPLKKGKNSIVWNGRDSNGKAVCSGIYFARVNHMGKSRVRKMMLLK